MHIVPSPCLLGSSNLSLKEAVSLISNSWSSYILLQNDAGRISGIFTKSDYLRLSSQLFEDPELGAEPIHRFMTKPVKTLSLELIHAAPEFMLENGVEHVPVTEFDVESKVHKIVGVVTARAVFEFMVKLRGIPPIFGGETTRRSRKNIAVLGADGSLYRLIHSIYTSSFYVDVERIRFNNFDFEKVAEEKDVILLDIDEVNNRVWLPIVKQVVEHPGIETVFVIYSPEKHLDLGDRLAKLESAGFFKIYQKPLDVSKLTIDLEKLWARVD